MKTCLDCGKECIKTVRGLCYPCYNRLYRLGELDKFDKLINDNTLKTCPICKKIFKYKHYKNICCSRKCGTEYRENNYGGRHTMVNCKICGKEFVIKNCKLKNRIYLFCSRKCYGEERKIWMKTEKYNPTLNKGHTDNTRKKLSDIKIEQLHNKPHMILSRSKSGKRKDLNNLFVRSSWEANFARYLNYKQIKWTYEPKTFIFEDYKIGTRSYTPDFYLVDQDVFIEIKGWFDNKSKTKIRRFRKHYPEKFNKMLFVIKSIKTKGYTFLKSKLNIEDDRIIIYDKLIKEYSYKIQNWE